MPKPKQPVLIGPPAAAAPTLAKFHRNVTLVLRGEDGRPDQLTSDTLNLTLVPGEKPPRDLPQTPDADQKPASPSAEGLAQNGPDAKGSPQSETAGDGNQGLFGGLTLRVHATGHARMAYSTYSGSSFGATR